MAAGFNVDPFTITNMMSDFIAVASRWVTEITVRVRPMRNSVS